MQNMQKPDYLTYSNEQVSQIISLLGQMQIVGIQNIKNMSAILSVLESPEYVLPKDAFTSESSIDDTNTE